jgi:uncharacterized protein YihD (DUF1040 family)
MTLSLVALVWEEYPDLRLGQLLLNVAGEADLYQLEDDILSNLLLKYPPKEVPIVRS